MAASSTEGDGKRALLHIPPGDTEEFGMQVTPNTDASFQVDEDVRVRFYKPDHKRDCCYTVWLYYGRAKYRSLNRDFEDWLAQIRLALDNPDQFMLDNEER